MWVHGCRNPSDGRVSPKSGGSAQATRLQGVPLPHGGAAAPAVAWVPSRKLRNRRHRAEHGNFKVVVANVTALNNLRLAFAGEPDVALVQELWASKGEVAAEAKRLGYAVAVGAQEQCFAAVHLGLGEGSSCTSRVGKVGRAARRQPS